MNLCNQLTELVNDEDKELLAQLEQAQLDLERYATEEFYRRGFTDGTVFMVTSVEAKGSYRGERKGTRRGAFVRDREP